MLIPTLPAAPSRTDPANFSVKADDWCAALPGWTDAANSLAQIVQYSSIIGTSATSSSIGTGARSFTTEAGKAWIANTYLFFISRSTPAAFMQGIVTSYNSSTGALVVNILNTSGAGGTYTDWDIGLSSLTSGATGTYTLSKAVALNSAVYNWNSSVTAFQLPSGGLWNYNFSQSNISQNLYYDGSFKYVSSGLASANLSINSGCLYFQRAVAGTINTAASMVDVIVTDTASNVGLSAVPTYKLAIGGAFELQQSSGQGLVSNFTHPLIYSTEASGSFGFNGHLVLQPRGSAAGAVIIATGSGVGAMTERARFDSSGNVGISIIPSTWNSNIRAIDISAGMSLFYSASGGVSSYGTNTYIDGSSNYIRKVTGYAAMYQQNVLDGSHVFYSAGTGTAGTTIASWTPTLKLDASGNALVTSNGGLGYGAGSGGTVTQNTSKSTGVTLNKVSGQITMNAAALAANTAVTFLVTNGTVLATDNVIVNLKGGYASYGTYDIKAEGIGAGSFVITLKNISGGSLSEAVVLTFSIIRGSTT